MIRVILIERRKIFQQIIFDMQEGWRSEIYTGKIGKFAVKSKIKLFVKHNINSKICPSQVKPVEQKIKL